MGLEGKVAIVTGASRGIGRAIAIRLAEDGADVVVNYRSKRELAEEVAGKIRALGRKALVVKGDMSISSDVQAMVKTTVENFGKIDILINNAGIVGPIAEIHEIDEKDWDELIDVNLRSVFLCIKTVVPHMIKQGGGKIVSTSSIYGKTGWPSYSAYCASKFAIIGLTQSAAQELAKYNITINAICPGITDTDMIDYETAFWAKKYGITFEEMTKKWLEPIPMGRKQKPEEQANLVAFLVSDQASYITGQAINSSGGLEMH